MRTNEQFKTKAEADAFVFGLNYVGDIDVDSSGPYLAENETWGVNIAVGEGDGAGDEDEDAA